jgi:EAL domain-containing protein (putative c-di-GMP-specific phosphodiesterase class I)
VAGTEYLAQLERLLLKHNVQPEKLCFELTETVAISNMFNAKSFIRRLRDIGCSFALDDFGTGMSSFSYLRDLPMDYVKIDAAFVMGITDPVNACIVESVKKVADLLDLQTVAEGIEEREQLDAVAKMGIDYFQGFYLDRPMPFEEFSAKVVSAQK